MVGLSYIPREMSATVQRLCAGFPIIGITGPRQSGKTTLAQEFFRDKPYVSLENLDHLDFALADPRRFLAQFSSGAVIDEAQRCPQLFSYLQGIVDENKKMGQFVLTGSQQFGLKVQISQTLAGRIGLVHLLPFSIIELQQVGVELPPLDQLLYQGFYPPIYDRHVSPTDWYANYIQTYIEKDIHQLLKVRDLARFRLFIRLCAGRVGQLLNLSNIGNECGVSHNTIQEWISILESSYIVYRLQPHHKNFSKRLVKTPKLYFYDVGLLCYLLGVRDSSQIAMHAMRGQLFENFIITEFIKFFYTKGELPPLYFWRSSTGLEVDLIVDATNQLVPFEIKSGATLSSDQLSSLTQWLNLATNYSSQGYLIYGGDNFQHRKSIISVPWNSLNKIFAALS